MKTLTTALAASLFAATACGAQTLDVWSTAVGGNAARDGLANTMGPTEPTKLWVGSRSAIVAQQGVAADGLFIAPRIANFTIPTGSWIVAHDLLTGVEEWAIQLPLNDPNEWRNKVSAIRDGQVYVTRSGGEVNPAALYALDPADGSIRWKSEDLIEERTTESLSFAADGDLIIGNFRSITRIDKDDGTTVWTTNRSCPSSNGCSASVYAGRAYVWESSGPGLVITAFDVASGARLYSSVAIAGGLVQQLGLMIGPDGTIYAPRTQNNVATDFFVALTDTGNAIVEKWRVPMGYTPFASFAIGPDESVYMCTTSRNGSETDLTIHRLDPATGTTLNSSQTLVTDFPAAPRFAIDQSGIVYFTNGGFNRGAVYSFNPDLSLRWTENVRNVNLGGPVLSDGVLVVAGIGSNVRAYRTACYADCDQSTGVGVLDIFDFLCFQDSFVSAGTYACDCDTTTGVGVCDIFDFLCFQDAFVVGCP